MIVKFQAEVKLNPGGKRADAQIFKRRLIFESGANRSG
jgi:hypothetical protein